jgi:hypothetical protein
MQIAAAQQTRRAPQILALFLTCFTTLVAACGAKNPHFVDMPFARQDGTPYQMRVGDNEPKPAIIGGVAKGNGGASANIQIILRRPVNEDNIGDAEVGYVAGAPSDVAAVMSVVTGTGNTAANIGLAGAALKSAEAAMEGKFRDVSNGGISVQTAPTNENISIAKPVQSQGQTANGGGGGSSSSSGSSVSDSSAKGGSSNSVAIGKGGDATNNNSNSVDTSSSSTAVSPLKQSTTIYSSPYP